MRIRRRNREERRGQTTTEVLSGKTYTTSEYTTSEKGEDWKTNRPYRTMKARTPRQMSGLKRRRDDLKRKIDRKRGEVEEFFQLFIAMWEENTTREIERRQRNPYITRPTLTAQMEAASTSAAFRRQMAKLREDYPGKDDDDLRKLAFVRTRRESEEEASAAEQTAAERTRE